MVDAMVNSVEDYLIDGLSFKLSPGASYVTDRRSVTFHPAGSNIYSPNAGTKVIRINLTGDGWLDPSTVRLAFNVKNNNPTFKLRPLSGGWSFFRRARTLVGGAIVDDVDHYNRVHEMLHILTSNANRDNDDVEGFGYRWDSNWKNDASHVQVELFDGVPGNQSKNVTFKPLSGLFNQPKFIPLMWCPITLEYEIVGSSEECIATPGAAGAESDLANNNTSVLWSIENVQLKCDLVTLDSALQNSYAEHVLSGKALPINYSTFVTQYQSIANGLPITTSLTRAVSRLKSVFISLDGDRKAVNSADPFTLSLIHI